MSGPRVSVLMPVRDGAAHLDEAVASILAQTLADLELVVVDDGSTDATPARLRRWQARDARVRVIGGAGAGLVAALNLGLAHCRAPRVARMDADDIARPERLAALSRAFDEDPALVVCGSAVERFGGERGVLRHPLSDAECRARLLSWNCFAHPAVMLRRDALPPGPVFEADYDCAEDYRLWSRLAARGRLRNLPEPLLRYRVHAAQVTQRRRDRQQAVHLRIAATNLGEAGVAVAPQALAPVLFAGRHGAARSLAATAALAGRCVLGAAGAGAARGVLLRAVPPLVGRGLRVAARNLLSGGRPPDPAG